MKWPGATLKAGVDALASTSGKESFVVGVGRGIGGGKGLWKRSVGSRESQEHILSRGSVQLRL